LSLAGLTGIGFLAKNAQAHHTESHFEDSTAHKLIYQCNKAESDSIGPILFSVGEMLREYGDAIEIIVTTFGPGVHLLGKKPGRPVAPAHQDQVNSLSEYGVSFHACGNTMKSLGWTEKDLISVAKVVPIGAADLMLHQERGFSYISW